MQTPSPVIEEIDQMVRGVPGWSPIDELYTLYVLALQTASLPGDLLEIGAWCGRSTVPLALSCRHAGRGRVFSVDLFPRKEDWHRNPDGTYSIHADIDGRPCRAFTKEVTVWKEPWERDIAPIYEKFPGVWEAFQDTLRRNQLTDYARPFTGTLDMFLEKEPGFRARLAFIDADHAYDEVCRDFRQADRHLVEGGWICFDDAFTQYAGVDRAIRELVLANPTYELGQQMTRKLFVARKRRASAS
jgi:hypothetical protein